jgi:hypothetical protein
VDLSMILRAAAYTRPTSGGSHKCKKNFQTDGWFCSRGTATMNGTTGEPPRIYLLP